MDAVRDRPGEAEHAPLEPGQEHRHVARRRMLEPEPANGRDSSGAVDPLAPADGAEDLHVLAHRLQRLRSKSRPFQSSTMRWLPVPSPAKTRPGASDSSDAKPIAVRTGDRL